MKHLVILFFAITGFALAESPDATSLPGKLQGIASELFQALQEENIEKAISLFHPDSPKDQRVVPVWFDWMPVFAILVRTAETFAIPGLDEKSEAFQAIKFRDALDTLKPAIDRVAVTHGWRTTTDLRGADLIRSLLADLDSLLG